MLDLFDLQIENFKLWKVITIHGNVLNADERTDQWFETIDGWKLI